MSEQTFRNHGELFDNERFEQIATQPEWAMEQSADVRMRIEELLEKKDGLLEELEVETLNEIQTQYYWIGAVLRCLGYTFSVAEIAPDSDQRPDFTLFYNAADFETATPARGEREFFSHAIGLVRGFAWDASLDEYAEATDGPSDPAFEIDRSIRSTGVDWGILTNGRQWRLYHRDTSGLFSTYFEVDLIQALQAADADQFKYFWAIFSPEGLGGCDGNDPIVQRMLH